MDILEWQVYDIGYIRKAIVRGSDLIKSGDVHMKDIFSELFHGKIIPAEQFVPKTKEYQEACKKYNHDCDSFEESLKRIAPALAEQFEGIWMGYVEISEMEQVAAFSYGFRLGVKLMAEAFRENEDKSDTPDKI